MEHSMYNTLLQLPLFQGMSRTELSEVVEKVKLHFLRIEAKKKIFSQGESCDKLVFLLSGELTSEIHAPCGTFSLIETFDKPQMIEPYSLFGKRPSYKATYTAKSDVSLLTIDKQYIYGVLDKYEVFRMNLLNLLSNKAEQLHTHIWSISPQPLEGRLAHFVRSLCTTPHGPKALRIKMDDLATLLDDTRLNISRVLNKWQQSGIIEMHRKEFVFHTIPTF
jgi:CRP-like cAMP-binding protein